MVELQIVVLAVAGSSPVGHPSSFNGKKRSEKRINKGSADDRFDLSKLQFSAVFAAGTPE
jgi:hypothetical protein